MMNNFYSNNDSRLNEIRTTINQMSKDDLEKLMNSEDEIIQFVRNLPEIQQIEIKKENLKENIRQLALNNLGKQPTLLKEKQKLAELHAELTEIRDQYKTIRGQYDDQTGEMSLEMIYILLQSTASSLEQESEQMAEDFFYGEKSEDEVTDFERRFIEKRKHAHELKIKAEKFHELMQMSQATSYLNSHPPNRTSGYR